MRRKSAISDLSPSNQTEQTGEIIKYKKLCKKLLMDAKEYRQERDNHALTIEKLTAWNETLKHTVAKLIKNKQELETIVTTDDVLFDDAINSLKRLQLQSNKYNNNIMNDNKNNEKSNNNAMCDNDKLDILSIIEKKEFENQIKNSKQKIEKYFENLMNNENIFNKNYHGNKMIDLFEKQWMQWDVNDTLNWFRYIITCNNFTNNSNINIGNSFAENDAKMDDAWSDSDDCDDNNGNNENENNDTINWDQIEKKMKNFGFRSKKNLPIMNDAYIVKQVCGIKSKRLCQLLCHHIQTLMQKYPTKGIKNSEKSNKCNEPLSDVEGMVENTQN